MKKELWEGIMTEADFNTLYGMLTPSGKLRLYEELKLRDTDTLMGFDSAGLYLRNNKRREKEGLPLPEKDFKFMADYYNRRHP